MTGWTSHLARRGIQAASVQYSEGPDNGIQVKVPAWGWALFLITGAIFAAVVFTVGPMISGRDKSAAGQC